MDSSAIQSVAIDAPGLKPLHDSTPLISPEQILEQARQRLPRFVLPAPELVPASRDCTAGGLEVDWPSMRRLAEAANATAIDAAEIQTIVRRALALLPAAGDSTDGQTDPHDHYFHIRRVNELPAAGYLRGLLSALELFLVEGAGSGELLDYADIAHALVDLWLAACGSPGLPRESQAAAPMLGRAPCPTQRWLRGHQVFAAITQGLIFTIHGFEPARCSAEPAQIAAQLLRMRGLYNASAAAFRFTADFEPAFYRDVIRPSMCEPHVPAGFSGTMSVDHGCLVSHLSGLRPTLAAARETCPDEYARMMAALAEVYDNHRWVCERFGGAEAPSLRTGSLSGDKAAVHMIERFKSRRLDMLA